MSLKRDNESLNFLFNCILQLNDIDECYDFFEDLCTVQELKSLSQRIVVAKMLSEKSVYTDLVVAFDPRERNGGTETVQNDDQQGKQKPSVRMRRIR